MPEDTPKKVKVVLKVPMSESDLGGPAAKAGDEVVLDAETAERWIASGTAVPAGSPEAPAPEKPAGGVPRRGSS